VLIRMADRWGQWSHCGLISERETVLEALAFKGVVETRTEDFFERVSHYEIVYFAVPSAAAGLRWAREQLGKGYDYGALFGNLFREPWQDDSRHDCAECECVYECQTSHNGDVQPFTKRGCSHWGLLDKGADVRTILFSSIPHKSPFFCNS
jgi:hypothetical protein